MACGFQVAKLRHNDQLAEIGGILRTTTIISRLGYQDNNLQLAQKPVTIVKKYPPTPIPTTGNMVQRS